MTPEGRVKAQVKKLLNERGTWHYCPVQNGMGVAGIPDFVCCVPTTITPEMVGQRIGVFLGVETKAPGKRGNVSPKQEHQIMGIHQAGGAAIVVDDVAQLKEWFDGRESV